LALSLLSLHFSLQIQRQIQRRRLFVESCPHIYTFFTNPPFNSLCRFKQKEGATIHISSSKTVNVSIAHFVFHQLSFIHKLKNVVIMSPVFMPRDLCTQESRTCCNKCFETWSFFLECFFLNSQHMLLWCELMSSVKKQMYDRLVTVKIEHSSSWVGRIIGSFSVLVST
jgi:hypothetical protein